MTNIQLIDEEDNKNMEPDYGDQFEDKKQDIKGLQQPANLSGNDPQANQQQVSEAQPVAAISQEKTSGGSNIKLQNYK